MFSVISTMCCECQFHTAPVNARRLQIYSESSSDQDAEPVLGAALCVCFSTRQKRLKLVTLQLRFEEQSNDLRLQLDFCVDHAQKTRSAQNKQLLYILFHETR